MYNLQEKLAYTVKNCRKNKGLSTQELATRLHVSSGLINNIENARNDVFKLELLTEMSKELNLALSDILHNEFISITDYPTENKLEITFINENIQDIEPIRSYIQKTVTSLLVFILSFNNPEDAAREVCNYIIGEIDGFKKIMRLK
jgi:transcriptional regulator with XRE-family HTH domain